MMENRSFDHVLGYLKADGVLDVEGLQAGTTWRDKWTNVVDGTDYRLHELALSDPIDAPPHGSVAIDTQIYTAAKGEAHMGGFVRAYLHSREEKKKPAPTPGAVMGYYRGD